MVNISFVIPACKVDIQTVISFSLVSPISLIPFIPVSYYHLPRALQPTLLSHTVSTSVILSFAEKLHILDEFIWRCFQFPHFSFPMIGPLGWRKMISAAQSQFGDYSYFYLTSQKKTKKNCDIFFQFPFFIC